MAIEGIVPHCTSESIITSMKANRCIKASSMVCVPIKYVLAFLMYKKFSIEVPIDGSYGSVIVSVS